MKLLGLDIGTTSISAAVMEGERTLACRSVHNDAFIPAPEAWARLQNPKTVWQTASGLAEELLAAYPDIGAIGVTGQQHGILYLDANGIPASPLYTWQDARGNEPRAAGIRYAAWMQAQTGYLLAPGYGAVTHQYNVAHGLVPENAAVFCTIPDYIAMRLCGRRQPLLDASMAASLGCFDLKRVCFDAEALLHADADTALFPKLAPAPVIGYGPRGLPVAAAIGDNQASYLGVTRGQRGSCLINIGTGSQISVLTDAQIGCEGLELRPFPTGGYLAVGASLCGGRAYALLERFFREAACMAAGVDAPCYGAMQKLLESVPEPPDCPVFDTAFAGTRTDPNKRGAITGIGTENFTPLHWLYGMLHGITDELYRLFERYVGEAGARPDMLFGSGNGLRKNPALCKIVSETFGYPLRFAPYEEEAACGAAVFAGYAAGESPVKA